MQMKKTLIVTMSALALTIPFVVAEEAHHPAEAGSEAAQVERSARGSEGEMMMRQKGEASPEDGDTQSDRGSGMMGKGMHGGQGGGMGMMGKGMQGGQGGGMGMMGKGMHGGQGGGMGMMSKGMDGGQGGMGMMSGGMHGGQGGMGMMSKGMDGGMGHGKMRKKYRKLMARIDLLEVRMIKMEAMLERLLLR